MAMFVYGMPCGLCGQDMYPEDGLVSFSPFVSNPDDPTYPFHDATVHELCLRTYPAGEEALRRAEVAHQRPKPSCLFCGLTLSRPPQDPRPPYRYEDEEVLGLPHMVYSPKSPAFRYNHTLFHRGCLSDDVARDEIYRVVESLRSLRYWKDSSVDGLLRYLGLV
ncbi:hypothetical protein EON81_25955 [bacterium]|nr:MAG: hypothetical protein EON81_25955 [bacterium]